MKVIRTGRKWKIEGNGNGWVFNKTFPRKFKAEIALRVYQEGGTVKQYWIESRKYKARQVPILPRQALEKVNKALEEIRSLNPTCDEIEQYGMNAGHGVVTITNSDDYFGPRLHDTWGTKLGGRVHIDIGCCGYHLMLDQHVAKGFIAYIKQRRALKA
jgi:hypothetical protein